jgi:hypothetical protein
MYLLLAVVVVRVLVDLVVAAEPEKFCIPTPHSMSYPVTRSLCLSVKEAPVDILVPIRLNGSTVSMVILLL